MPHHRLSGALPFLVLLVVCASLVPAEAQYFGRNKVQYESFDFEVLTTPNFDIYHYSEEADAVALAARMAERWRARLARVLNHNLTGRQPLVLYASHPHFEQTNVVDGLLGEGTGGVTESLKRRVVMPFAAGLGETNHVLGHELVHAFQYDMLGRNTALPLWFIEGMAEYLSLGSRDPHTAVWVRDAAISERLPTLEQLDDPRYFPYRFGHAFWAYVGGRWGDAAIADIMAAVSGPVAQGGAPPAGSRDPVSTIEDVLGIDRDTLAADWHRSIADTMVRPMAERASIPGRTLIEPGGDFEINVGPALSPDGRRLAFLSSRDLLSIDLFVADTSDGRVLRKLVSTAGDPHFESLQFISSAGTWDPAGRLLAITALRAGRPVLAVFDTTSGDRIREITLDGVDEAVHPAWSPDGRTIAFSGMSGGLSDLFLCELATGKVARLTTDLFADLQPSWHPDGRRLVFATDRYSSSQGALSFGPYQIAEYDLRAQRVSRVFAFEGANHYTPQWSSDGRHLYFVADHEGVPNVFRLSGLTGTPVMITSVVTGVTGITPSSPALSVAPSANALAFVLYRNGAYQIRHVTAADMETATGGPRLTHDAGQLAPGRRQNAAVDALLANPQVGLPDALPRSVEPYTPRLSLDYIGQEFGVGVGNVNRMGAYMGGGVALLFSDMLGDHTVSAVAQVNGGFQDFAGQVGYVNRRHRWNWGGFYEQLPYVTGLIATGLDSVNGQEVIVEQEVRDTQTDRQLTAITAYPFNRTFRFETSASLRRLTFDRRVRTRLFSPDTGALLDEAESTTELGAPLNLGEGAMALVRDTSVFGATSPILGHRSRFEVAPSFGDLRFTSVVADVRQYVMPFRPLTIAGRFLHVGRYGGDGESARLSPLFVGFPNLVRGYDIGSFEAGECGPDARRGCPVLDNLVGSRLLVAGAELRAPLVGVFTGDLDYGPIPVELIAFFDAGVAWNAGMLPKGFGGDVDRPWARSLGAGVRINALGYLVLELDAVRALDRPRDGWRFSFGVRPGY